MSHHLQFLRFISVTQDFLLALVHVRNKAPLVIYTALCERQLVCGGEILLCDAPGIRTQADNVIHTYAVVDNNSTHYAILPPSYAEDFQFFFIFQQCEVFPLFQGYEQYIHVKHIILYKHIYCHQLLLFLLWHRFILQTKVNSILKYAQNLYPLRKSLRKDGDELLLLFYMIDLSCLTFWNSSSLHLFSRSYCLGVVFD